MANKSTIPYGINITASDAQGAIDEAYRDRAGVNTWKKLLGQAGAEYTAQAGGGCVSVVCDGQGRFKSIKLTAEAINPENPASVDEDTIETLEDLITAAISQASQDAQEQLEAKMKSITGGINIPGLF